jgi:tetratricopeptide (TPR) repeat protein
MTKPVLTATWHKLPFMELSAQDFERLCLWLVQREGYERAEYLGESGGESGRDVVAWKKSRRFVFQCKRVQSFTAADALKEITKLRRLPKKEQPHQLVFVVSRPVSATTRKAIRKVWGDPDTCHFWAGSELDEKVKKHPDLLTEFFQLPPAEKLAPPPKNLPFASLGPLFQGREPMLDQLHKTLARTPAGRAAAIAGKAVHGLGGVGKTRLAVEYGWRYAAEYSAVLFVVSGSPADLRRNLAALCASAVLALPEKDATEEDVQVTAVLRWLSEHPGWLLILDNVDSEEAAEAVDTLIPRLQGGHVLLTGRLAHWGAEVEPIELDVLSEEAAISFLLDRTAGRRRSTSEDSAQAASLARELGCLPLALEQAGAAIAKRRLSFAGNLREWHARRDEVLAWFDARVSHYPASFAVTWQTSVDRLSAPARRLLERLAWLGPEPIPESLLEVPVPGLAEDEAGLNMLDVLGELATYSLVTRAIEAPTFTVHRLVKDVTRRSLQKSATNEALREALGWVDDAFVGDPRDVRTWGVLDPLAPHARAVVAFADEEGISEPTARLMNNLAQLFDAKALFGKAEPLMRRALAIGEASFGPDHLTVAIRLNNLALLLKATNRLGEAEPLMRRALAIDRTSFGPDHPNVARDLNNLAQVLHDTDRLGEAEPLMRRALAIDETSFGPDHPTVAIRLSNLALLLKATNRLGEAEPLMARVVTIFEKNLGENHPNVAVALNNLASLLWSANLFDGAEPLMRRAVAINETSFGPNHPKVAVHLNNLARLLHATNRVDEAEPLAARAVMILTDLTRRTGHEHPHLQAAFRNYHVLLQEMGKSEAEIKEAFAELGVTIQLSE